MRQAHGFEAIMKSPIGPLFEESLRHGSEKTRTVRVQSTAPVSEDTVAFLSAFGAPAHVWGYDLLEPDELFDRKTRDMTPVSREADADAIFAIGKKSSRNQVLIGIPPHRQEEVFLCPHRSPVRQDTYLCASIPLLFVTGVVEKIAAKQYLLFKETGDLRARQFAVQTYDLIGETLQRFDPEGHRQFSNLFDTLDFMKGLLRG